MLPVLNNASQISGKIDEFGRGAFPLFEGEELIA